MLGDCDAGFDAAGGGRDEGEVELNTDGGGLCINGGGRLAGVWGLCGGFGGGDDGGSATTVAEAAAACTLQLSSVSTRNCEDLYSAPVTESF